MKINFCLKNQDGKEVCLKDFKKDEWIVLYFYPKDNTPGCTIEAMQFTKLKSEFEKRGAIILGISPDSEKSHCNFIEKQKLKIQLLSDQDKKVTKAYGAYGKKILYGKEFLGVIRSTFIINPDGEIVFSWKNVNADGHAKEVLDKLKYLM